MTFKPNSRQAVRAINRHHLMMVYPLKNRPDVPSLWNEFYKRSKMTWAWDSGADSKVANLWIFREHLQHSNQVAYLKFFQGRATFLSLELLKHLIAARRLSKHPLSTSAARMLDSLIDTSPQSTKELKKALGLKGKPFEGEYHKAAHELWSRGLIVGRGERDDGAFPSLLVAATEHIFEDTFKAAMTCDPQQSHQQCLKMLGEHAAHLKYFLALQKPKS